VSEKGILAKESKETAEVILFFDELFDSVNGSYYGSKKKSWKPLLGPVTPTSSHQKYWTDARKVFKSMKFYTENGKSGVVPSITNWLQTLENLDLLMKKLATEHNLTSIWIRHFNQDPLENFFGCVRSHGVRNVNPTCAGFEVAFAALLINNLSSNHSPGANCEKDKCVNIKSLRNIFFENRVASSPVPTEIDFRHITSDDIIVGIQFKKNNPKVIAQLEYVAGYVLRKTKTKVFKNCPNCNNCLFNNIKEITNIAVKEYKKEKKLLTYPATELVASFSDMQDVIIDIIKFNAAMPNIKNYIKTVFCMINNYNYITCQMHKKDVIMYITFACSWSPLENSSTPTVIGSSADMTSQLPLQLASPDNLISDTIHQRNPKHSSLQSMLSAQIY
ncbi:unnamed protein product, partial [Plutella xylostella]